MNLLNLDQIKLLIPLLNKNIYPSIFHLKEGNLL